MQRLRIQLQLAVFLGCMSALAHAAPDCGAESKVDTYADGFSPVHSRSLTAMYFPNAIRRAPPEPGSAGGMLTPI